MDDHYIFTSLTRNAEFNLKNFEVKKIERSRWSTGDFVLGKISNSNSPLLIEISTGRMIPSYHGYNVIGALGERYATLEATGTWKDVDEDLRMHMLTGAGLLGKLTSKSVYIPNLIELEYGGHVHLNGEKSNMIDFTLPAEKITFSTPSILMVGTSMSAGKTTSARIIIRQLVKAGLKIVGAKLTGAGRYKDILSMQDAGADNVFDFVDVGLPSSICPQIEFADKVDHLLSIIQSANADVAILEIGASPLEPYNGETAIKAIGDNVKCTVLCASDPYAVYGVMHAFNLRPDIVSGIATNTEAGTSLIEELCNVKAINLIDKNTHAELRKVLSAKLNLEVLV